MGNSRRNGINIETLRSHISSTGGVLGYSGYVESGLEMLGQILTLLFLLQWACYHGGKCKEFKAPLIIEAANGPVSAKADTILRDRGNNYSDLYANAGGIYRKLF